MEVQVIEKYGRPKEWYIKGFLEGISEPEAEAFYGQIKQVIDHFSDPKQAALDRRWSKNEDFQSHGVPREIYKALYKQLKKPIKALPFKERLALAKMLVTARMNEQAGIANLTLSLSIQHLTPDHFDYLSEHVGNFCSWGATDSFCIDVLQPLLRKFHHEVLDLLGRWNQADNPWKRRASVVAFTRKVGASGAYTEQALALCENLVWDKAYYVQKGVGWALKDVMRGDREKVLDYVSDLRRRGVSSIITLYAIKDLKGAEREEVLSIRAGKGNWQRV